MSERRALVIIDMQNGFINRETKPLPKKIRDFVKEHKIFDCIIKTKYINHKHTACYQLEQWMDCMENSEASNICNELANVGSYIIKKDKYTCFTEDFKRIIRSNEINKIYFCGVNTGCCVLHSVLDAYEDVLECYVIEDLCGSTSGKHYHDISIELLKTLITEKRVITTKQLLESIYENK